MDVITVVCDGKVAMLILSCSLLMFCTFVGFFLLFSTPTANGCASYQTCKECQANPECGWCDDETGTGLGTCIEGSYRGPMENKQVDYDLCPADRWFFVDCPCKY